MVKTPPSGGDTIFTSQVSLFDKLSPTLQKTFEGLHAIHTSDVSIRCIFSTAYLTVRWKWTPGAVAFWDNRSVVHKALPGGYDVALREGKRTAIHGERPFFDPERSESLTERDRKSVV